MRGSREELQQQSQMSRHMLSSRQQVKRMGISFSIVSNDVLHREAIRLHL